jgi:hypothetical protein
LVDFERFEAGLDEANFPRAVVSEVNRARGRPDLLIIDINKCTERIAVDEEPPSHAAHRRQCAQHQEEQSG